MSLLDAPKPVREGEELDLSRLRAFLQQHLAADVSELEVQQFPGGYSNLTYSILAGDRGWVLRRPPLGARVKSGHDMNREYRVLSGLAPVYPPAPKPLLYCDDESILGAPFYLMERRRGVVIRRRLPKGANISDDLMHRMCRSLIDGLVELHAVDLEVAGLSDLGRPDGYVERQVAGWIGRWEKSRTEDVPDMDILARWLRANLPPDVGSAGATLVHNDYKFDNVMLDPDDLTKIVAVLDWEMCTCGDPLMDLGTTLGYWAEATDDDAWKAMAFGPTFAPGAMSRRQIVDHYARRTGRDMSCMLFYYCFGLLKIAVIGQQIYYRFVHGHTADQRFAVLGHVVKQLAAMSRRAIERGHF